MRAIVLLLFFLTSCCKDLVEVHSEYVNHARLASVHAHTPDPRKEESYFGQRIHIVWKLSKAQFCQHQGRAFILLSILHGNHVKERISIPLEERHGHYTYSLMNDAYCEEEGILSYKVELILSGVIAERWIHHTWTEWIDLDLDHNLNHNLDHDLNLSSHTFPSELARINPDQDQDQDRDQEQDDCGAMDSSYLDGMD